MYIIIPPLVQTPTLENPQSKMGDYAWACWPLSWDAASVYIIKKCSQRDPCWAKTELLWPAVGSLEGENSMSGSVAAGRYGPRGLPERAAGSCTWMVLLLFKYSPLNFRRQASAGWHTHTKRFPLLLNWVQCPDPTAYATVVSRGQGKCHHTSPLDINGYIFSLHHSSHSSLHTDGWFILFPLFFSLWTLWWTREQSCGHFFWPDLQEYFWNWAVRNFGYYYVAVWRSMPILIQRGS